MENLKYAGKLCVLMFLIGLSLIAGSRTMEIVWPKEEMIRIVHYVCAENDDGDVSCGRIKSDVISGKLSDSTKKP